MAAVILLTCCCAALAVIAFGLTLAYWAAADKLEKARAINRVLTEALADAQDAAEVLTAERDELAADNERLVAAARADADGRLRLIRRLAAVRAAVMHNTEETPCDVTASTGSPPVRRHKTGQARVRWRGKDYYLGVYGSPEAEQAYRRLLVRLEAGQDPAGPKAAAGLTVAQAYALWLEHARADYDPAGREAARLARVSPETVIRWILHDGLAAVRRRTARGHRYLVDRRALLARLERPRGAAPVRLPLPPEAVAALERMGLLKYVGRGERPDCGARGQG